MAKMPSPFFLYCCNYVFLFRYMLKIVLQKTKAEVVMLYNWMI